MVFFLFVISDLYDVIDCRYSCGQKFPSRHLRHACWGNVGLLIMSLLCCFPRVDAGSDISFIFVEMCLSRLHLEHSVVGSCEHELRLISDCSSWQNWRTSFKLLGFLGWTTFKATLKLHRPHQNQFCCVFGFLQIHTKASHGFIYTHSNLLITINLCDSTRWTDRHSEQSPTNSVKEKCGFTQVQVILM